MSNLLKDFNWKDYGVKHGLDTEIACLEHAILASVEVVEKKVTVFDWRRYIQDHPDLQRAFGKGGPVHLNDATCHYLSHGKREKRKVFILGTNEPYVYDFDWKMYDKLNPDVFIQRHRNVGEWHCFRHWCEYGYKEGRETVVEQLVLKTDASISEDDTINKKWRNKLKKILDFRSFKNVNELVHQLTTSQCKIHNVCKNIKSIIICSHSNLSHTAGDTIMVSNWINHFMDNNIHVTLLSKYPIPNSFVRNLVSKSYTLIQCKDNDDLIIKMDELQNKNDRIFIRNHEILDKLRTSSFLHKICFYGLDIHLDGIALMQNKFHSIITQSEQLKTKYVEKGVLSDKIEVVEPLTYKYNFELPERKDNEIRLIYCGTLRDEENILEIIEEFQKIHKERHEMVLKIVYGKINGNVEFTKKVNGYIKKGVPGITFKHNLSHRDSCYEIATSDIGICWRKNGWGENGEVSTKVKEYKMYDITCLDTLLNLKIHNINDIIENDIIDNHVLILCNKFIYSILTINMYSNSDCNSEVSIKIDNKRLCESNILINKSYITPNFIDCAFYKNIKWIYMYGKNLSKINIFNKYVESKCDLKKTNLKKYLTYKLFSNKIAYIGDVFTYNSLTDLLNVDYISKKDALTVNIKQYDCLYCDSTWSGIDGSWDYAFSEYSKKHSSELKQLVEKFKQHGKKCIYYNKEDPTHFNRFYKCAELFDIIITTSYNCVEQYKKIYPDKIIINKPFLCNPVVHNPINNKKEETIYFVGGIYKHFPDRLKHTYKLFDNIIKENFNLKIIDRFFFLAKSIKQLSNKQHHVGRYELDNKYLPFSVPGVSHEEAINTYKNSLLHLNINTVTDCKTMSSRRLMELLACGCNVLSNNSDSIQDLNLPVITDVNMITKDLFTNYNLEGFYYTHCNLSYVSLIMNIYKYTNIHLKSNIKMKIQCDNIKKLPKKYHNYLNPDEYNFILICNRYEESYIEKLLIYLYFFDGNVEFTNNKIDYFTIASKNNLSNTVIISKINPNQTLLIPYIPDNLFQIKEHYDNISINDVVDSNSIFVVMCLWNRIHYLEKTLKYLENQNVDKLITLCIWNNNNESTEEIDNIINNFKGKKVKVIIHHSPENVGGIGRFIFVKYICEKKHNFENVIFIDDDQILKDTFITRLLKNKTEKSGFHWYGKKFYKDKTYWDSWKNLRYKERSDYNYTDFNRNILDYGATCGMIIDTECFLMDDFYNFNKEFQFVEDLWMSYYVITKLGYKLFNGFNELKYCIENEPVISNDANAQWTKLTNVKDIFLKSLREEGGWNV